MKKLTIQYTLVYDKRSRHYTPARFSFHIQGRSLNQRRDIEQFMYYVARWTAKNIKGEFRVTRYGNVPMFVIYDRASEAKFEQYWTSFPQSGRQNVYVCTFV
jgi:hypothetical protein